MCAVVWNERYKLCKRGGEEKRRRGVEKVDERSTCGENWRHLAQRVKGGTKVRLNKVSRLRSKVRGAYGRVEK